MQSYSFVSNDSYFNEAQALYIGLFDAPQSSLSGGLQYWEGQLALNQTGALNAISNYATYNGQPLSSSNITGEIVNIYHNLLGITVSSSNAGVQYWASQWNGDGGSQSIGQITADIYNAVENSNSSVSEVMNDKIMNYYNEAQSLYIGLLNVPATANGLTYWEGQLAANQAGALNSISTYAGLDGLLSNGAAPLTASNIGSEINDIYEHLFGLPVTSAAETYWASQWTGDGGTQSIGQITADIYNIVETLPSTNSYYEALNNVIPEANTSLSFQSTLADINDNSNPQSFTMPTSFQVPVTNGYYDSNGNYIATSYQYSYIFPASTTQSDTLVLPASSNNLTITDVNNNTYYGAMTYAFTGDSSGHNTVDVSYQASGGSGLTNYLADAANFQTLDFNYSGSENFTLNLDSIHSGFNTFVLDNGGTNGSGYTFQNTSNNDTFIVQSAVPNSDWVILTESTNTNTANLILEGVSLQGVSIAPSSNNISTINIDSYGTGAANSIAWFVNANSGAYITSANALNSTIMNIVGTQSLTIGGISSGNFYINSGETITVNGDLSGSNSVLTLNYTSVNNGSSTEGATINASGYSGTLTIDSGNYQQFGPYANDNVILGSGTDTFTTNGGSDTVTVGSGNDTIIINSTGYSTNNYYITTVQGNINTNDSISFNYNNMIIQSFTQLNESSASTEYNAISAAIATLNAANTTTAANVSYGTAILADAWFTYKGDTYIVNSYNDGYNNNGGYNNSYVDKVVQLIGINDLSGVSYNTSTTSTISHL